MLSRAVDTYEVCPVVPVALSEINELPQVAAACEGWTETAAAACITGRPTLQPQLVLERNMAQQERHLLEGQ